MSALTPFVNKSQLSGILILNVVLLTVCGTPAPGESREAARISAGVIGVKNGDESAALLNLGYAFPDTVWTLYPHLNVFATSQGAAYVGTGLGRSFSFGKRLGAYIEAATGVYIQGNGKDLGSPIEFRTAAGLQWKVSRSLELGITASHLSNSSISERNPGIETVSLDVTLYSDP